MASWPPASVAQRRIDLRDTVVALRTLPQDTPDIVNTALSRYLVVRAAGFIEAVRDDVADTYTSTKSSDEVAKRVRLHLRGGQGVAPTQLLGFVKSYSISWHDELDKILCENDNEIKDALGALVNARKKVADGDGERVTVSKALKWADISQLIADWLVERFNPDHKALEPVRVRNTNR